MFDEVIKVVKELVKALTANADAIQRNTHALVDVSKDLLELHSILRKKGGNS